MTAAGGSRAALVTCTGALMVALTGALCIPGGALPAAAARTTPVPAISPDAAVAFGQLLDTPVSSDLIEQGLDIAEGLRLRYGIDTGNLEADREEAARRAQEEFLDTLSFSPEQIEATAEALGYSLDPAECANFCDNVRQLAVLELQMRALREFASAEAAAPEPPSRRTH